jgi:predicted ATPase
MLAWADALMARPVAARLGCRRALALAARCNHPFSRAYAHSLAASVCQTLRLARPAARHAAVAVAIAHAHDFPYWRGWGEVVRGWAAAEQGNVHSGLELLRQGLEIYEATGARQIRSYALALNAQILADMGQITAARDLIETQGRDAALGDVAFFDAEILRLRGLVLADHAPGAADEMLGAARRLAREQGAVLLELRAAGAQARLRRHLGWSDPSAEIVAPVLARIGAGEEVPDVADALAQLASTHGRTPPGGGGAD